MSIFARAARGAAALTLNTPDGATLLDLRTGKREFIGPDGPPSGPAAVPGVVADRGRSVVFTSDAADLVPGDTNAAGDVFLCRLR